MLHRSSENPRRCERYAGSLDESHDRAVTMKVPELIRYNEPSLGVQGSGDTPIEGIPVYPWPLTDFRFKCKD